MSPSLVETVSGQMTDRHFISDDLNLALTFTNHGIVGVTLCDNKEGSLSDQGVIVQFETPINSTVAKLDLGSFTADNPSMEILQLAIQAVPKVAIDNTRIHSGNHISTLAITWQLLCN